MSRRTSRVFFFFNDTATTEIYTLSLHDALPILTRMNRVISVDPQSMTVTVEAGVRRKELNRRLGEHGLFLSVEDRKSTRLNSSHANISYAVFCLKKKKTQHLTSLFMSATSMTAI